MSSDSGISKCVVAEEVRRVLQAAAKAGALETLTRRTVTGSVAEKLELKEDELKEHKNVIKITIEKFLSENDVDEPGPSEDGKRKPSPDIGPEIPAKKVKRDSESTTSPKSVPTEGGPAVSDQPKDQEEDIKSESELSVLIDEPPKRKKSAKKSKGASEKISRKPKEKVPPSKNEETIKKYKALIIACGLRKQWVKELAHCETDRHKIAHLKSMLSDLGMTGRMSIEQAKAIREKRELRQEIEDVVQFEESKGVNAVPRRSRASGSADPNEGTDESDGEPSAVPPPKRVKPSAARSIMAFLKDQSESE